MQAMHDLAHRPVGTAPRVHTAPPPKRASTGAHPGTSTPAEIVRLQRSAGNQAVGAAVRSAGALQRQPRRGPTVEQRQNTLEGRQDALQADVRVLEKKQRATAVDLRWRATFGERLASYQQAIYRISNGINAAANGFREAQSAQAQTDQMKTQVLGLVLSVAAAGLFEPLATAGLGVLAGKFQKVKLTAERIDKIVERAENPVVAAVGGTVSNVRGVQAAGESQERGRMPAVQPSGGSPTTGDALAFLTQNLETLAGCQRQMEQAFASRSAQLDGLTPQQWAAFDPAAKDAEYQQILTEMNQVAAGVERLKDAGAIAAVYERYMWSAWLRRDGHLVTLTGSKAGIHETYDLGTDIEARLMAVGVGALAGVTLTGHWYSSNSPANWGPLLIAWARDYRESIATN
jgi:hypothetical protein